MACRAAAAIRDSVDFFPTIRSQPRTINFLLKEETKDSHRLKPGTPPLKICLLHSL
jgi:hypothetical protein